MDNGLIVAGIIAAGNVGGIAFLVKKYTDSVDRHNESLPGIIASLQEVAKTAEKTGKHLDELFASRNDHERRIERIETVHDIRGCNEPTNKQWRSPLLDGR